MRKLVSAFERRKPERHLRQLQEPRLKPQRTTEALSAKERRAMAREPVRR